MNVCVGDIIKLENNQFVAVRDKVPFQSAGLFFLFGRIVERDFPRWWASVSS
jgi:hypothetical protein